MTNNTTTKIVVMTTMTAEEIPTTVPILKFFENTVGENRRNMVNYINTYTKDSSY